jgi:hypothetical protein
MPWTTVSNYHLGFGTVNRQFSIYFQLDGEPALRQLFVSAAEFAALADMLRNEGPVNYNTDGEYFVTGPEPVGEGEAAPLRLTVWRTGGSGSGGG